MFYLWVKKFTLILLFFCLILVGANFILDPYIHYRVPNLHPPYFGSDQRHLNPGLAKNFSYDSVIIGTSMTEQIHIFDIEKMLGWKTLKLSISGATAHEQLQILSKALEKPSLKNVLWGVDVYSFGGETESYRNGKENFPHYLYDSNFLNDFRYLLNIKTLLDEIDIIKKYYLKKDRFYFAIENSFLPRETPKNRNLAKHFLDNTIGTRPRGFFSASHFQESLEKNLFLPIKSNPSVHFHIVFPPYSILAWHTINNQGWLLEALQFRLLVANGIQNLPNASLYDPQSDIQLITQLDHYVDPTHYLPIYNDIILRMIKDHQNTTLKEIKEGNERLHNSLKTIDPLNLIKEHGFDF